MRNIEKILILLFCIAIVCRFINFPGSVVLITFLSICLCIGYLFFSWYLFKEKHTNEQNITVSIIAGLFLSTSLLGIVFKINIWPGSRVIQCPSLFVIGILIVTLAIMHINNNKKVYCLLMIKRCLFIGFMSLTFLYIPTYYLIKIIHRNNSTEARLLIQTFYNPENEEYQKEYHDYREKKDKQ